MSGVRRIQSGKLATSGARKGAFKNALQSALSPNGLLHTKVGKTKVGK